MTEKHRQMGTSLRVLSERYPMNTKMTRVRHWPLDIQGGGGGVEKRKLSPDNQ